MAELQEVCNRAIANIDEKNPRRFSQFSKMEFNVCLVRFQSGEIRRTFVVSAESSLDNGN
jgi:hypothetical protein